MRASTNRPSALSPDPSACDALRCASFFIYFAHQTVHVPLQQSSDRAECAGIAMKWRRIYCSMLVNLDDALGRTIKLVSCGRDTCLWIDGFA